MINNIILKLKELYNFLENNKLNNWEINRINSYISKINKWLNDMYHQNFLEESIYGKIDEQKQKTFNWLSAKEWALLSRNVWNDLSSVRKNIHTIHWATYPKSLSDRLIIMYSKKWDLVFDPFLWIWTTMCSCQDLWRNGLWIELNTEFYEYAKNEISHNDNLLNVSKINIYNDDCRNLDKYLEDNSVQITVTSPPYADFIHKSVKDRNKTHKKSLIVNENNSTVKPYSDKDEDFWNLSYDIFLSDTYKLLKKIYKKTKIWWYSAWVVKDYRDTKNKVPYIDFHSDLAKMWEKAWFKYQDLIIWDQNEQRSLVLLWYPSVFYTNQNCSFIVILRKI